MDGGRRYSEMMNYDQIFLTYALCWRPLDGGGTPSTD
jgi:hypothetical protein